MSIQVTDSNGTAKTVYAFDGDDHFLILGKANGSKWFQPGTRGRIFDARGVDSGAPYCTMRASSNGSIGQTAHGYAAAWATGYNEASIVNRDSVDLWGIGAKICERPYDVWLFPTGNSMPSGFSVDSSRYGTLPGSASYKELPYSRSMYFSAAASKVEVHAVIKYQVYGVSGLMPPTSWMAWVCSRVTVNGQAHTGAKKQLVLTRGYTSENHNVGYFYEDFSCQEGEVLSMPIFHYEGTQDGGRSANVFVQTVICVKA